MRESMEMLELKTHAKYEPILNKTMSVTSKLVWGVPGKGEDVQGANGEKTCKR